MSKLFLTMPEILDAWAEWEAIQFPQATTLSRLKHLQKEINELIEDPQDLMEYVDCFALLTSAMRGESITLTTLILAMGAKLEINKKRKWGEVNEKGFVEHVGKEIPDERPDNNGIKTH